MRRAAGLSEDRYEGTLEKLRRAREGDKAARDELAQENMELGILGFVLILLMGNATFFLLDKLLGMIAGKLR